MKIGRFVSVCFLLGQAVGYVESATSPWWGSCPRICMCSNIIDPTGSTSSFAATVDCSNSGLHHLPVNVSEKTEALILSRNRIRPRRLRLLERLTSLVSLDVSSNHVYSLDEWHFRHMGLRRLSFERNLLDYVPSSAFETTPGLLELRLSSNRIEEIHRSAFGRLVLLRELDLAHNRLYELDTWLESLTSLRTLDLGGNTLHSIGDGYLGPLPMLRRLILSDNAIKHVHGRAFWWLKSLETLQLDRNLLTAVPSAAFTSFVNLGTLSLSQNPLSNIQRNAFAGVNVSTVRANGCPRLRIVEENAFSRMMQLRSISLSDNPKLVYISPKAWSQVPRLSEVSLEGTSTMSLNQQLATTSLQRMSLPAVHCDCVNAWLIDTNVSVTTFSGNSSSQLNGPICRSPEHLRNRPLRELNSSTFPVPCTPRMAQLFPATINSAIGESLRVDCRAVAEPPPSVLWYGPDGSTIGEEGSLYVDVMTSEHSGIYTCRASNEGGVSSRSTTIRILNTDARVIILSRTCTSITVTWHASKHKYDLRIVWRSLLSNDSSQSVVIKPYMRSYTVAELIPDASYRFCVGVARSERILIINCSDVSTRATPSAIITNVRTRVVAVATVVMVVVTALVITIGMYVRRYNARKRAQEAAYGENLSQLFLASMDSLSDSTPITFENPNAVIFDQDDIDEIRRDADIAATGTAMAVTAAAAAAQSLGNTTALK